MSGDEVKAIRLALGLTQQQLATQIGVSRTYVGLMERGQKIVSARTRAALKSARPNALSQNLAETDPILRRIESALVQNGVDFQQAFRSEDQEFEFYLPEMQLAITVNRGPIDSHKRTRQVRDILVADGKGAAETLALLLEGQPLRLARPVKLPVPLRLKEN